MTDKEPTPQITHAEGCWKWGPAHYECALKALDAKRGWIGLTPTEIGEVIASLESDGHTEDGLEADCPACTAAQKLRALIQH